MLNNILVGALLIVLVYVSYTDLKTLKIPNTVTIPAFCIVFVLRLFEWQPTVFLGLIPAVFLYLLYGIKLRGIRLCGAGDVKLMAVVGLVLPYSMLMICFYACAFLLLFFVMDKLMKGNVQFVPFAPFLTIAIFITVLPGYLS